MKTGEIQTAAPFNTIFPIGNTVLASVVADMKRNGFDPCHPVILWKGKNLVIDGHTRLEAARLVKLPDVPAVERDFTDEDEALRYAIRCQRERRNLTDADIMRLVEELDKRRHPGERTDLAPLGARSGKSAEETAKVIGTSTRTVERVRTINAKATPEVKAAVESGKLTINAAANTTRKPKAKAAPTPEPATPPAAEITSTCKGVAAHNPTLSKQMLSALPYARGISQAERAIRELTQIEDNDTEREAAFDHVAGWIEQHSAEPVDDQAEGDTDGPRLSTYTATIQGRNIRSVQAQLRKVFGDAVLKVEKIEHPTSRSARLAEAEGMVEQAKGIVEELHGEMESWQENTPDNMRDGMKAEEVSTCAESLQEIVDALEVDFASVEFPGMY